MVENEAQMRQIEPDDDRTPLPLLVAKRWGFPLQYYIIEGEAWYSVLDWIKGITGAERPQTSKMWTKMKIQLSTSSRQLGDLLQSFSYLANDNKKYASDFAVDRGLYLIAQNLRVTKARPALDEIKRFLAAAGAFVDEARRDPDAAIGALNEYAEAKEHRKLMNEGFSPDEAEQWIRQRQLTIAQNKHTRTIWASRGAHTRHDFGRLNNRISKVALGDTATQLKQKMELSEHDTPRNYISAADQYLVRVTEQTAVSLHEFRDSQGVPELVEDIEDTQPILNSMREATYKVFSKRPRRLPRDKKHPTLPVEGN